jgi:hypothetical protein
MFPEYDQSKLPNEVTGDETWIHFFSQYENKVIKYGQLETANDLLLQNAR